MVPQKPTYNRTPTGALRVCRQLSCDSNGRDLKTPSLSHTRTRLIRKNKKIPQLRAVAPTRIEWTHAVQRNLISGHNITVRCDACSMVRTRTKTMKNETLPHAHVVTCCPQRQKRTQLRMLTRTRAHTQHVVV